MFKKLIAYFRNGGAIVMHLLPPQPFGVEEGILASRFLLHGTPPRGRGLAVWEIPAYQRRQRSGDRVLRQG